MNINIFWIFIYINEYITAPRFMMKIFFEQILKIFNGVEKSQNFYEKIFLIGFL